MILSGLCLGQPHQWTAFAALERNGYGIGCTYHLKALERFRPGEPYPGTFATMKTWYQAPELSGTTLVVDITGVGKPLFQMLQRKQIGACLQPALITAGHHASENEDGWTVPKKDLAGALQAVLQTERIKFPSTLGNLRTLRTELSNFRVKNTTLGGDPAEPWRDSEQSDLVLAIALPVWFSEKDWTGLSWTPGRNPRQFSPMYKTLYEDGPDRRKRRPGEENMRPA